jgi:hypothetical protein
MRPCGKPNLYSVGPRYVFAIKTGAARLRTSQLVIISWPVHGRDRQRSSLRRRLPPDALVRPPAVSAAAVPEDPDSLPFVSINGLATSADHNPFAAIVALGAFERFVFVMSVLEGHSEQECAILLRCSRRAVMIARLLALTRLANTDADYAHADEVIPA